MLGLLPEGSAGAILATSVADSGLRNALEHPELFILPEKDWPEDWAPDVLMASQPEWEELRQILYDRNIVDWIADEKIPTTRSGRKVFGGCFGVVKKRGDRRGHGPDPSTDLRPQAKQWNSDGGGWRPVRDARKSQLGVLLFAG